MKILVYTVLIGNYDILSDVTHENNIDYYCFTNNKYLKSDSWNIIQIDNKENLDDTRLQIKYKFLGDTELEKNYDLIIYADANCRFTLPIHKLIEDNCDLKKYDLFFLKHHERDCTYDEAKTCIELKKDNKKLIEKEINFLKMQKFPMHYGLVATGLIIRKANNLKIQKVFNDVFNMVQNYSKRDQLAIMYCIWKDNYKKMQTINLNFYDNKYICIDQHLSNLFNYPMGNADKSLLGTIEHENKYQYECKITDENDSHAMLAREVKDNSKVLDVGCSTGIIGKLLKENKNCIVDGIEVDKKAYQIASEKKIYRNLYNFYIGSNSADYKKFIEDKEKYDYIIFADVLEHVSDPCKIINEISQKLNKNGKILVSIPNIANVDIIKNLLNQKFNYNNTGILDSTHLRFFTRNSFIEMIDNYNELYDNYFNVEYIGSTYLAPQYKDLYYILTLFDKDLYAVQNLYCLTLVDESEYRSNILPSSDFFEKLNSCLSETTIALNSDKTIIENLNNEIKKLKEENHKMDQILKNIYNSKSWKLINKIRSMRDKVSRR